MEERKRDEEICELRSKIEKEMSVWEEKYDRVSLASKLAY